MNTTQDQENNETKKRELSQRHKIPLVINAAMFKRWVTECTEEEVRLLLIEYKRGDFKVRRA